MKVDNAIIMAAGMSSRFAPLSHERHKAMTIVKGEVMIERQIRQILDAGVDDIYIITGYKAEQFDYLVKTYGVKLIRNAEYKTRNNNSSIWAARNVLKSSYVCSADNYFEKNPFEKEVDDSYYAAEYADGQTQEWCLTEDDCGYIDSVTIGGAGAWYMMGHTFWSGDFSRRFLKILEDEYDRPETANKLWEKIFMAHLDTLKMKIRKYSPHVIREFDTMEELREFDKSYLTDTRSEIIKKIANKLRVKEEEITNILAIKLDSIEAAGFEFDCPDGHYKYYFSDEMLKKEMERE